MKAVFVSLFLCFAVKSMGQQTVIHLENGEEKVNSIKNKEDNGLRVLQLTVVVSVPNKKLDRSKKVTFKVGLSNFYNELLPPQLIDSVVSVYDYVRPILKRDPKTGTNFFDSTQWFAYASCSIKLLDTSSKEKTFNLFREKDLSSSHIIVIAPDTTGKRKPAAADVDTAKKDPVKTDPVKVKNAVKPCIIHLTDSIIALVPNYASNGYRLDTVRIHLTRDSVPKANETDTVVFSTSMRLFPFNVVFNDTSIIIKNTQWNTGNNIIYKDTFLLLQNTLVKTVPASSSISIGINCDQTHRRLVQLTGEKEYTQDVPFWAEIGTNFDLVDKVQAQNIYGGIFMFQKDIAKYKNRKIVSFTGGVYETKSISLASTSDSGIIYRDGRSFMSNGTGTGQGYPYFRDTGSVRSTSEVTSIGIFFSPNFRLNDVSTNENGFHWYLSLYAEMLWQRVHTSFDYSNARPAIEYRTQSQDELRNYNFKETSNNKDYRSHYLGVGLPIYIRDYDPRWKFSLYINTVLGVSTQKFIALQNQLDADRARFYNVPKNFFTDPLTNAFADPKHGWNAFYLFQFRLNEEKIGLSFTGEVRGFLLPNSKPIISLSLSKKFDIGSFYNSITKSPSAAAAQ